MDKIFLGVDLVLLGHHIVELLVPHDDGVENREVVELVLILPEHGKPLPFRDDNLTGVGADLCGEDLEEGGLTGAVGTDDAVAVAGSELDVDVLEENAIPVSEGDIGSGNHDLVLCTSTWRQGIRGRGDAAGTVNVSSYIYYSPCPRGKWEQCSILAHGGQGA